MILIHRFKLVMGFFYVSPSFTLFRYNFQDAIRNDNDPRQELTFVNVVSLHGLFTNYKGNIFFCAGCFDVF